MRAKVTEKGVVIPKKLLAGADEVEIRKTKQMVLVVPRSSKDPIHLLGTNPVLCNLPDASENLDAYLYPANR